MNTLHNDEQFASFDLGMGRAVGVVIATHDKNVTVEVVACNRNNKVTNYLHRKNKGNPIKRHIVKHNVEFFPIGTKPHLMK